MDLVVYCPQVLRKLGGLTTILGLDLRWNSRLRRVEGPIDQKVKLRLEDTEGGCPHLSLTV